MKLRKLIVSIAIGVATAVYLHESRPSGVVVTPGGSITGFVNRVRESIQGRRFWSDQLSQANSELDRTIASEAQHEAQMAEYWRVEAQTASVIQESIARNTNLSPALRQAVTLTSTADRFKQVAGMQSADLILRESTRERTAELRQIIATIESRFRN